MRRYAPCPHDQVNVMDIGQDCGPQSAEAGVFRLPLTAVDAPVGGGPRTEPTCAAVDRDALIPPVPPVGGHRNVIEFGGAREVEQMKDGLHGQLSGWFGLRLLEPERLYTHPCLSGVRSPRCAVIKCELA